MSSKGSHLLLTDFPKDSSLKRITPLGNNHCQRWLSIVGFLVLLIYTATRLLIEPVESYVSVLLVLLGFGGIFLMGRELRFSPPIWMLLGAVIVVLLSWTFSHVHHPDWAESSPKVHRLTIWFLFIAVAWLLGGETHRTFATWGVFALSLLSAPWLTGDGIEELLLGFQGKRIDFGINNAQHTAMLYALAFLGLIAFSRRFIKPGKARILRTSLWIAGLLISGAVTVMAQTRGVWLGCIAAGSIFVTALIIWLIRIRSPQIRKKIIIVAITVAAFISAFTTFALSNVIEHRIIAETKVIEKLFSDVSIDNTSSSIAYRIVSWEAAIPWIKERPLIGWGGNGRKLVLDHSKHLPSWIEARTEHLHSSYMDILTNFGFLGLALFLAILIWTTQQGIKAWRRGVMPGDMLTFYLGFVTFWLIVNSFESFMFYSTGQYAFALVVGGIVTHIWRMQTNDSNKVKN